MGGEGGQVGELNEEMPAVETSYMMNASLSPSPGFTEREAEVTAGAGGEDEEREEENDLETNYGMNASPSPGFTEREEEVRDGAGGEVGPSGSCEQNSPSKTEVRKDRRKTHLCPECGKDVRVRNLASHMKIVHPKTKTKKDSHLKKEKKKKGQQKKKMQLKKTGKEICPICGKLASR